MATHRQIFETHHMGSSIGNPAFTGPPQHRPFCPAAPPMIQGLLFQQSLHITARRDDCDVTFYVKDSGLVLASGRVGQHLIGHRSWVSRVSGGA